MDPVTSPNSLQKYTKPWLSVADQISLLEKRGLAVPDKRAAEVFLSHLGYYRFSGFCLAFEKTRHEFQENAQFPAVVDSYYFDVALRDLLMEALEAIEVDVRAAVAYIFGNKCGAFGHVDKSNFRGSFDHETWLTKVSEEVERSSELFVDHFRATYEGFPQLPFWISTEVMSFGAVSKMFGGFRDEFQSSVANRYGFQKGVLESALHHFSYVRNICAHHLRLWDRSWSITPQLPHGDHWKPPLIPDRSKAFVSILLVYRILKKCKNCEQFSRDWRRRINELLKTPPACESALLKMGLPEKWFEHPLWS